jgi:predicted transcriptional regulator
MTLEKALRKLRKEASGLGPEIAKNSGLPEYTVRRVLRGEAKNVMLIAKVVEAAKQAISERNNRLTQLLQA